MNLCGETIKYIGAHIGQIYANYGKRIASVSVFILEMIQTLLTKVYNDMTRI